MCKIQGPFFDVTCTNTGSMGLLSRPCIVQTIYHKLYNVLGQLSAIFTRVLTFNTHPWLGVEHVGISVIFDGRCHTQEAELHYYAFVTLKLCPNSHCRRYATTSSDLQKDLVHAAFTEVQVQCDADHRRLVEKLRMRKNSLNIGLQKSGKSAVFR